jgi:signal transduction histidine kinase
MLHDFIVENRAELIERCRVKLAARAAPRVTNLELERGVPLFLDQFVEIVRSAAGPTTAMSTGASKHGGVLLHQGFTVAQVVHDYGGICQAITELAVETKAPITALEFKTLNLCLDDAIAEAVTEYARQRAEEGTERTGRFAHELGGLLHSIGLAFDVLKSGEVGMGGSTSKVIDRSLMAMSKLIERELTEVRLGSGVLHTRPVVIRDLLEDIEITASLEAKARGLGFSVTSVDKSVVVNADAHILTSVVSNLLHNAFKFTKGRGSVVLRAHATAERVYIEVEDQCGGLASDDIEALFRPYEQKNPDRSGMGLGLAICRRGARSHGGDIVVRNQPGVGCVFVLELPRGQANLETPA